MKTFRRAGLACGVLVALVLLGGRSRGAPRADVYALVGGRVATVSGSVLVNGTVVLRDGLIESVGASATPPPDARVIDVKGLTLTPGIIDGFGGIGLPEPAKGGKADAAESSPLAPQAFVLDRIRAADALKARDEGITTALVVPREGVLPGRSVLLNLSGDRPDAMVVRQPAFLHLHMATLGIKYPGSLMGTMAYARQALLDAARYRDAVAAYEKAPRGRRRPRYDAALAAWQDVLAGRQALVVTATRENDIRRALALADEFKVKVVIAGAMQAQGVAELLKARKVPLLVSVNFDPPQPVAFDDDDEDTDKERREIEAAERNPAALHRAGVAFALVSGHAPDFLAGVRKAVERGLPREAALRAVTLGAAEALGVADRLGSLEAGKIANVVAWSGEPLTAEAKAKMVFVDGELYEPDDKPSPSPSPSPAPSPSPSPVPSPSPSPSPSPGVIR
jgi:imidazolonepropionase-like amidohydrolase